MSDALEINKFSEEFMKLGNQEIKDLMVFRSKFEFENFIRSLIHFLFFFQLNF